MYMYSGGREDLSVQIYLQFTMRIWMTLNVFNCSSSCMTDKHKIGSNNMKEYIIIRSVVARKKIESYR